MKRKTLALILSGAGVVLLAFLWHAGCGISLFAKVDTQPAGNSHTNAEMQQAVSLVRKDFRRFNGCVMTRLTYDEAQNLTILSFWIPISRSANHYPSPNLAVLRSTAGNGSSFIPKPKAGSFSAADSHKQTRIAPPHRLHAK